MFQNDPNTLIGAGIMAEIERMISHKKPKTNGASDKQDARKMTPAKPVDASRSSIQVTQD